MGRKWQFSVKRSIVSTIKKAARTLQKIFLSVAWKIHLPCSYCMNNQENTKFIFLDLYLRLPMKKIYIIRLSSLIGKENFLLNTEKVIYSISISRGRLHIRKAILSPLEMKLWLLIQSTAKLVLQFAMSKRNWK